MTKALRQWQPTFEISAEERASLIWEFERTSRGQYDIDFPSGPKNIRVLVSGFDPFSLGNPGSTGTGVRIGNPSGANALSLDGQRVKLPNGTTAAVESYILPVNYTEFMAGMVEDTVAPHMQPGPKRVDASISVSQGGAFEFWLEHWNGRPTLLGDLFRVSKIRGDKRLTAVCKLWTHQLGWEVRPEINGDFQRSAVFRSQDEVLTAGETWKAAMLEKGWN